MLKEQKIVRALKALNIRTEEDIKSLKQIKTAKTIIESVENVVSIRIGPTLDFYTLEEIANRAAELDLENQDINTMSVPIGKIMNNGVIAGSGILISKTQFLTAGHVAEDVNDLLNENKKPEIWFNYFNENSQPVKVEVISAKYHNTYDFGIIKVNNNTNIPPLKPFTKKIVPMDELVNTEILLIGLPGDLPMKVSLGQVSDIDINQGVFNYNADTVISSSGSAVFKANPLRFLGIHIAEGLPALGYNTGLTWATIKSNKQNL